MFYGLFLRGHSAELLRRDIEIPRPLFEKLMNSPKYDPTFRESLARVYRYRRLVLAIFDELVCNNERAYRLQ